LGRLITEENQEVFMDKYQERSQEGISGRHGRNESRQECKVA
jgi:hypothetical protein